MAKFHINDKGESGQCRAEKGGCPFGGEAQHYSSPENARKAYEFSMAGEQIATVSKRPETKEERVQKAAVKLKNTLDERLGRKSTNPYLPLSREEYDPKLHNALDYDEVFYDEPARRKKFEREAEDAWPSGGQYNKDRVQRWMIQDRLNWSRAARTEPAKSFEERVPIRLIPTGSTVEVLTNNGYTAETQLRIVGMPVDRDGVFVGRYRAEANKWEYVTPDTALNIGYVGPNEKLDPRWREENEYARVIADTRAAYAETPPKKLTNENYDSEKWAGVPLETLKFDAQPVLDKIANQGLSRARAAKEVRKEMIKWDAKTRTEVASDNEDGVPVRLIPVGAEVAIGDRRSDGTIEVGTMMAPKVLPDGTVMGRIRVARGVEMAANSDTVLNVGFIRDGSKVSPRWKRDNEFAAIVKEQRARVQEFEQGKKTS